MFAGHMRPTSRRLPIPALEVRLFALQAVDLVFILQSSRTKDFEHGTDGPSAWFSAMGIMWRMKLKTEDALP